MIQYISGYAKKNIRILYRIPYTVPLETMGPFARGKTLSLPNVVIAANSLWWDENQNRGKDESNREPR